jgi:hypothetical protein
MHLQLHIDLGNEAMSDLQDLGLALIGVGENLYERAYAGDSVQTAREGRVKDANGNTVGRWELID